MSGVRDGRSSVAPALGAAPGGAALPSASPFEARLPRAGRVGPPPDALVPVGPRPALGGRAAGPTPSRRGGVARGAEGS